MDEIYIANLEIRPEGLEVLADGIRTDLTVREYQLFAALANRPNRVVQRQELYEIVWGGVLRPRDRSVDVLVRKIRDKLDRCAPEWVYIHTHFGVGYRFFPERTPAAAQRWTEQTNGDAGSPASHIAELRTI